MTTTDAARVAAARRWFRTFGSDPIAVDGITVVSTPAHPDTWEVNFATPAPDVPTDVMLSAMERYLGHTIWQATYADALTSPEQEAGFAFAGFAPQGTVIEMLATGALTPRRPLAAIALRPVESASDRAAFETLVALDHAEGKRTGSTDDAVNAGLLAAMHARGAIEPHDLIIMDGEPVGYGYAVPCPGGLGVIENLFTRADRRGQGIMSAYIVAAAERLRARGCDGIFLDAHAGDTPRLLYAALGFAPVSCARYWVREVTRKVS